MVFGAIIVHQNINYSILIYNNKRMSMIWIDIFWLCARRLILYYSSVDLMHDSFSLDTLLLLLLFWDVIIKKYFPCCAFLVTYHSLQEEYITYMKALLLWQNTILVQDTSPPIKHNYIYVDCQNFPGSFLIWC